ncbi:MAG: FprA family A-type flavoprotein [Candidatus Omnitrophota bacterium]
MKAREIKKGIYWVGAIDWDLRNFHGYLTQKGTTYNAYLIIDDKITLVDTVKHYLFDEMLRRIKSVIDPAKIDYIVSNHVEMDHSGSIPRILEYCKNAVVITSPNGEKGLKQHFKNIPNIKTVQTGSSVSLGKRDLNFVLMPMVHWPDSMATYIPQDKLLLPNDAFGQHIASPERFDDEIGWDILREDAAKYYANIVMPYGAQVLKVLEIIKGLKIDMVAPSHGIIWRSRISDIIEEYGKWAGNIVKEKAVIVYDTMWGSTKKIAQTIQDALEEKGISVRMADLAGNDISDIMTHVLESKYICVGSPTLNNNIMPKAASFLTYLKGLAPKNRIALVFGSYGWGGQSVGQIENILKDCGFDVIKSIKTQYIPSEDTLKRIGEEVEEEISKKTIDYRP